MATMRIEFVTTFSKDGYRCYGQRLIDSFVEHSEFPLTIYHESMPEVDFHKLLTWRNLDHDTDRKWFIHDANERQARGENVLADWRRPNQQSVRFCHKVFALTHAATVSEADWLIWIDADVEITAKLDDRLMDRVLADSHLTYLGRPRFPSRSPYTECGFVAYKVVEPKVRDLLADMRDYYVKREIWKHPPDCWHDSYCFDLARKRSRVPPHRWRSLSDGSPDPCHVWPHTILAEFSRHHKGPVRKTNAYGSAVK